ncbi:glutathione S-transferase C-terminal domain-containing protein [Mesorhizobium caraganae]|uniref:glutathione S-transferase C-terminal domain-containing protein n=1 Tax=Mesorhizobium caraganae TaxID=483206 RepID=UPI0035E3D6C6
MAQLRLHRALHPDRQVDPREVAQWDHRASQALAFLEENLRQVAEGDWLATAGHPSIADVALYPYTRLARMGGVDLDGSPHVLRWLARIERLPNYTTLFPGRPELNESTLEV